MPEIHEARALLAQSKFAKAATQLDRALEIAKYAVGEQSYQYAELVELKADCKFSLSNFGESAPLFLRCIQSYMKSSKIDDTRRVIGNFVASVLKAGESIDLKPFFAWARSAKPTSHQTLDREISIAKLQILSLDHHKKRLEKSEEAMRAVEEEIKEVIESVPKEAHVSDNVDVYMWSLCVGRWYQTLFELRGEQSSADLAKEAYEEALKVSGPKRVENLVKADALLGLGDMARLASNWEEADEYYKKSIDLTDQHFDRDSQRVRHVIEREAIIQFHLKRWIHAEGLLRRLIDYYHENKSISESGSIRQVQHECMQSYVKMMESRGRTGEAAQVKSLLDKVTTVVPSTTFDPYAF